MNDNIWTGMMLLKELLAAMNRGGKSKEEEDRIRQIMREVMTESTSNAPEKELMSRMMQLLEHNMTKQTAELHTTAQERDLYKAKMEQLNRNMERLLRSEGNHASEEEPGLTARQRKLAEMLEELKDMRGNRRRDDRSEGKPFNKGGGGRGGASGGFGASDRKSEYQGKGAYNKFGKQNKDVPFDQGKRPYNQNRQMDRDKFQMANHEDCKSGGFQRKPFQQEKQYQKGSTPFQNKFPQHGEGDGRQDFGPHFGNSRAGGEEKDSQFNNSPWQRDHGRQDFGPHFGNRAGGQDKESQFNNSPWQRDHDPQFRDGAGRQNEIMQDQGPIRGFFQHRGQFHNRGQFQHYRGQFNPQRGQFNPQRGQFHQHRGQFHNHGQGRGSNQSNPFKDIGINQLTPDEIEAIKEVLKQQKQQQQEQDKKPSSSSVASPSKTAFKKKKKQKKPKAVADTTPNDDSDDDDDDDDEVAGVQSTKEVQKPTSAELGATALEAAADKKIEKDLKKKKNRSKDQDISQRKPEDSSPLELFVASGFDLTQTKGLNLDDKVKDMMLIAKEGGEIVSYQPGTVRELIEFKQKYPNAQAILVQSSEGKK